MEGAGPREAAKLQCFVGAPAIGPELIHWLALMLLRTGVLFGAFAASAFARVAPPSVVPEPGTLILLAVGVGALALAARKRLNR